MFTLVIFFMWNQAGGSVTVPGYTSRAACQTVAAQVNQMPNARTAFCVEVR